MEMIWCNSHWRERFSKRTTYLSMMNVLRKAQWPELTIQLETQWPWFTYAATGHWREDVTQWAIAPVRCKGSEVWKLWTNETPFGCTNDMLQRHTHSCEGCQNSQLQLERCHTMIIRWTFDNGTMAWWLWARDMHVLSHPNSKDLEACCFSDSESTFLG